MISDKVNKNNSLWTAGLCKILLVTSFMNAGLRSSPESAVTVFRVLAMLTIPFLLIRYFRLFVKELLLVGGILVLSLIQYFLFSITSFELIASSFVHLTSSGGIMSNYMFWCIVYYVFILESEPWNNDVRKIKET